MKWREQMQTSGLTEIISHLILTNNHVLLSLKIIHTCITKQGLCATIVLVAWQHFIFSMQWSSPGWRKDTYCIPTVWSDAGMSLRKTLNINQVHGWPLTYGFLMSSNFLSYFFFILLTISLQFILDFFLLSFPLLCRLFSIYSWPVFTLSWRLVSFSPPCLPFSKSARSASLIWNLFHVLICLICFSSAATPPRFLASIPSYSLLIFCHHPHSSRIATNNVTPRFAWSTIFHFPSLSPISFSPSFLSRRLISLLPLSCKQKSEKGLFLFSHLRRRIKEAPASRIRIEERCYL